jgi:protein-tyrosine phosphatase
MTDKHVTLTSSFFVKDQALFGSWPTQSQVNELEKWGVDIFVNLTMDGESKIVPYHTRKKVIRFPIPDRSVPVDKIEFCRLVIYLAGQIDRGKKIYIHCKGGHGRAGILVSCLLGYRLMINPREAIHMTKEYHSNRVEMNPYWRIIGAPQTSDQKTFVYNMFKEHHICESSPFYHHKPSEPLEQHHEAFLLQTYLGNITGPHSDQLLKLKWKIFENNNKYTR